MIEWECVHAYCWLVIYTSYLFLCPLTSSIHSIRFRKLLKINSNRTPKTFIYSSSVVVAGNGNHADPSSSKLQVVIVPSSSQSALDVVCLGRRRVAGIFTHLTAAVVNIAKECFWLMFGRCVHLHYDYYAEYDCRDVWDSRKH